MMKTKTTKPTPAPETKPTTDAPVAAPTPTPDADRIARLRAAPSSDEAVRIMSPDAKPKATTDATYEVVETCQEALPQKRGLAVLVYVTAVRMNKPFKIADVEAALPDRKSVRYWVRTLAKSGHLAERQAS